MPRPSLSWPPDRATIRELIRFGVTGTASAGIYFLLMAGLHLALDLPVGISGMLAYGLGMIFNYLVQYHWTFRSTSAHASATIRYLVIHGVGIVCNAVALALLTPVLGYWTSQGLAIALIAAWSYLVQKLWVFRNDEAAAVDPTSKR